MQSWLEYTLNNKKSFKIQVFFSLRSAPHLRRGDPLSARTCFCPHGCKFYFYFLLLFLFASARTQIFYFFKFYFLVFMRTWLLSVRIPLRPHEWACVLADEGLRPRRKYTTQSIYLFIFYTRTLQCLEVTDAWGAIVIVLVRPSDNLALKLLPRLTWKEATTSIKPRRRGKQGYRRYKETPLLAWNVLRVALLWRIWCTRNEVVFWRGKFNV
jgi:hypothetical protein